MKQFIKEIASELIKFFAPLIVVLFIIVNGAWLFSKSEAIRKDAIARVEQSGNVVVPNKKMTPTSGDETERVTIEVTRSDTGKYQSQVKEVVIEEKVPDEVKTAVDAFEKAGYTVEVNANGKITMPKKESK